jgi:type IV secretion system protein VirD4
VNPLPSASLFLGWHAPAPAPFGFASASQPCCPEEPLIYAGDGHLLTIGPSRSGKGRGVLAPNLLLNTNQVNVLDPKAELYHITARRRHEMGHRVGRLDPCQVAGPGGDTLNPFGIFNLAGADLETDAQVLGSWLAQGNQGSEQPFWDIQATALLSGLIAHVASSCAPEERNLDTVRKLLLSDDTVYNLAALLDTHGKTMNRMAHDEIAAFLQTTDITRSGILATAQAYLKPFLSPRMAGALGNSTVELQDIVEGGPLSLYMILPPDKLKSHRALLKMWVGTLLKALLSRTHQPPQPTLMLLDECAQLGHFPWLETIITLSAGYGVQCWAFFQDMAQLRTSYPDSWQTLLNNCAVLQTFGVRNRHMASQWGEFLEHSPEALLALSPEQQVVRIHGRGEFACRRADYLNDQLFAGLFDDNPLHVTPATTAKRLPAHTRLAARSESHAAI